MLDAFGFVASRVTSRGTSNLYRSAAPSDHPSRETLEHLGVKKIFCLIGSPVEASRDLRQYGFEVEYLRFDIPAVSPRGVVSIANRIRGDLQGCGNLDVCCRIGRARTGLVIAAYRLLFENWDFEDVERERAQFGAGWNASADETAIRSILAQIERFSSAERKGRESGIVVRGPVRNG
jgi:hypothetical protein